MACGGWKQTINFEDMARIINIIRHPHLATYKACDDSDYRCCVVCDYKVFIETDDGEIIASSVLDDDCMKEFDIEEAITKEADGTKNQDWYYRFDGVVKKEDIDSFVKGSIEEGWDSFESFRAVLGNLRESNCILHSSGMDAIKKLKAELDKTIDTLRD